MDIINLMKGDRAFYNMKKISLIAIVATSITLLCGFVAGTIGKSEINILMYGLDGRGNSEDNERSDAILLVNLDLKSQNIVATSIPRDSYVKITCRNNIYDKINHAYAYGGQECLNETVSQLFGINNVYNVKLNFDDVVELVDFFGLIKITPNYTFCQSDEITNNKYCFEKGKEILIDGRQALAYMRNRKSLPNGDFDRIKNQRQILKIIINEFFKLNLMQKIKFYKYAKENIETDINFIDIKLTDLINMKQIKLNEYTLKGKGYTNKYYYYKLDSLYLEKIKKFYI